MNGESGALAGGARKRSCGWLVDATSAAEPPRYTSTVSPETPATSSAPNSTSSSNVSVPSQAERAAPVLFVDASETNYLTWRHGCGLHRLIPGPVGSTTLTCYRPGVAASETPACVLNDGTNLTTLITDDSAYSWSMSGFTPLMSLSNAIDPSDSIWSAWEDADEILVVGYAGYTQKYSEIRYHHDGFRRSHSSGQSRSNRAGSRQHVSHRVRVEHATPLRRSGYRAGRIGCPMRAANTAAVVERHTRVLSHGRRVRLDRSIGRESAAAVSVHSSSRDTMRRRGIELGPRAPEPTDLGWSTSSTRLIVVEVGIKPQSNREQLADRDECGGHRPIRRRAPSRACGRAR